MSQKTLLFISIFTALGLFFVSWPYILIIAGALTLAVWPIISFTIIAVLIFLIIHLILIPYYAFRTKEEIGHGDYRIEDAREPRDRNGGDEEI